MKLTKDVIIHQKWKKTWARRTMSQQAWEQNCQFLHWFRLHRWFLYDNFIDLLKFNFFFWNLFFLLFVIIFYCYLLFIVWYFLHILQIIFLFVILMLIIRLIWLFGILYLYFELCLNYCFTINILLINRWLLIHLVDFCHEIILKTAVLILKCNQLVHIRED